MSAETLWTRIREKPFRPFRLLLSSGDSYDVRHPEFILITKHRVTIAITNPNQPDGLAEREVVVSPLHIAGAEDLPQKTVAA